MTTHTLRYYERIGLIQPVGRERNGHRRYSDVDETWLKFLHSMRATHMPIREMLRYAALRESGNNTCDEQRKILEDHRTTLQTQITSLEKANALLARNIEFLGKLDAGTSDQNTAPLFSMGAQNDYGINLDAH
jgi:DNA-binding transcriptional MerR regulator